MKLKSSMLSLLGLGLVGWLALGVSSASAQSVYFETYAQPYPVVEPYPVVVAPRYVVRPAVVAAPVVRERTVIVRRPAVVAAPVVRERTVIVSRPAYVPAPLLGPPMPPPYLVADW
jgi:hypothetical protein